MTRTNSVPVLSNPRHERFAQELAKGLSASDAMQSAGFKSDRRNSTRLTTNKDIKRRVAEIQERGALRSEVTVASLTAMLLDDRKLARELGQPAAAVSAIEKIGKLHQLFVERTENVNINHDVSDRPLSEGEWADQAPTAH